MTTTVNGKIDKLTHKLDDHIVQHTEDTKKIYERLDELKPIQSAWNSGKIVGEGLKWITGVGVSVLLLKNWLIK